MEQVETYELITFEDPFIYMFYTKDDRQILKRVSFDKAKGYEKLYNVSLGDMDPRSGETDFMARSNHKNRDKVLATVVSAVYKFTSTYPDFGVIIEGNQSAKTMMYRMGLHKYYDQLSKDFEIHGVTRDTDDSILSIEKYIKEKKYHAIVAERKIK